MYGWLRNREVVIVVRIQRMGWVFGYFEVEIQYKMKLERKRGGILQGFLGNIENFSYVLRIRERRE